MMKLYVRTGCPYCIRVLNVLQSLRVPFEEKNIADVAVADELDALGGKQQVPFLVDGDVSMYESQDIIKYIETKYGAVQHDDTMKGSGVCPVA
jgi:glutaredoxin 3